MSVFEEVVEYPPDQIYGLMQAYREEKNPQKVDLSIGVYRGVDLKPSCLRAVREAEKTLASQGFPKMYLPIDGLQHFNDLTKQLVFGQRTSFENVYCAQSIGGSGSLRMMGEFLVQLGFKNIALPVPTWPNHRLLFTSAGLQLHHYSYYDNASGKLQIDEVVEQLSAFPDKTAVLFHGCCHNPTGLDPTPEEWQELSRACKEYGIFPVFDVAYLGLGDGIESDAYGIRHFFEQGHEMMVACSFSKNFGLYGERVGALLTVAERDDRAHALVGTIKRIIRGMYSSPPSHGALIVSSILSNDKLHQLWQDELVDMRDRMSAVRQLFAAKLSEKLGEDFGYLNLRKGMFAKVGLSEEQVTALRNQYGIYMPSGGRINLCGMNQDNLPYVVNAICDVKK